MKPERNRLRALPSCAGHTTRCLRVGLGFESPWRRCSRLLTVRMLDPHSGDVGFESRRERSSVDDLIHVLQEQLHEALRPRNQPSAAHRECAGVRLRGYATARIANRPSSTSVRDGWPVSDHHVPIAQLDQSAGLRNRRLQVRALLGMPRACSSIGSSAGLRSQSLRVRISPRASAKVAQW